MLQELYTDAVYGTWACRPSTLTHRPRWSALRWNTSRYFAGR